MPRIFALADLHLSLSGHKPMDRFGAQWVDHAIKMAENWDARVCAGDVVLLAGDLSWARNFEEVACDLAWIEARPGRKILLKGNHDSWWGSPSRMRRELPPNCDALHNNALEAGDWVVVGGRGWIAPNDPIATEQDGVLFHRELERLKLSIRDADARFDRGRPRIAMLHFPPWVEGREPTGVVQVLEQAGVRVAVYGHLHGADHDIAVRGRRGNVDYRFVAADAIDFAPIDLGLEGEPSTSHEPR